MQFNISTLLLVACYMTNVIVPTVCTHYLPLKRIFPLNSRVDIDTLRARDRARHSRMLHGSVDVINFTLQGDPNSIGFYTTKVKLGSPPKEFTVVVDTGSSAMWVNCKTCSNCNSNALGFTHNSFDTTTSSTAVLVQCSDIRCPLRFLGDEAHCSTHDNHNQCTYSYGYQDGSKTSGVYVSDEMYFDTIHKQSSPVTVNSSATIVFGCSTKQSGAVTETGEALDGVFGFGHGVISVFSQLSSKRIIPKVFSHCLNGDTNGGGILVFGAILEPNIVYSPMVPSQFHYTLNLQSIYVNGKQLPINPKVFAASDDQGTIVDSGTTLTYIVKEAYNPLVHAITADVSRFATPFILEGNPCYTVSSRIDNFPSVSLNFVGGAFMKLKPAQYLVQSMDDTTWCIGFQKVEKGLTILGDLVLNDRLIVYDLANQRIGWTNHRCSMPVNISETTYAGESQSKSSSSTLQIGKTIGLTIVALLMHITYANR